MKLPRWLAMRIFDWLDGGKRSADEIDAQTAFSGKVLRSKRILSWPLPIDIEIEAKDETPARLR